MAKLNRKNSSRLKALRAKFGKADPNAKPKKMKQSERTAAIGKAEKQIRRSARRKGVAPSGSALFQAAAKSAGVDLSPKPVKPKTTKAKTPKGANPNVGSGSTKAKKQAASYEAKTKAAAAKSEAAKSKAAAKPKAAKASTPKAPGGKMKVAGPPKVKATKNKPKMTIKADGSVSVGKAKAPKATAAKGGKSSGGSKKGGSGGGGKKGGGGKGRTYKRDSRGRFA